jgi:hypothetical protein
MGHRRAGPNVVVLLHPNQPPGNMKNTESEATFACAGTTNPPLKTPPSCARGPPNPPHGSTLRTRLKDCRRSSAKKCRAPRESNQAADHRSGTKSSRCFPLAQVAANQLETEEVTRAVFRRCTAPGGFSHAGIPAAVRCRPSPLWLLLPQAPSNDAVPHRTGDCKQPQAPWNAASGRNQQPREDNRTPVGGQVLRLEVGNTLDACRANESSPAAKTNREQQAYHGDEPCM